MDPAPQESRPTSRWGSIGSFILTFAVLGLLDGFVTGGGDRSAEGAYVRIVLAAVGFGALFYLSKKTTNVRNAELLFGAAWGVAVYGLGQVAYTPLFTEMREFSQR